MLALKLPALPAAEQVSAPSIEEAVVWIPIASLSLADSPRIGGEDPEHLRLLVAAEGKLPPIVVHRRTMRVIDGRYRVAAAKERGEEQIEARFFNGDEADAFVLAVTTNIAHGLPLSLRERTAAAARIVEMHPDWSDRGIASLTGISARTVAELRVKLGGAVRGSSRRGRDGRIRSIDGTSGRLAAAELIKKQPDLSLRQVAQAAGISPETARDVRNRLRNGQSPVPDRRKRPKPTPEKQAAPAAPEKKPADVGVGRAGRVSLLHRLQSAPEFRDSEACRVLLRLLLAHTAEADDWERLVEGVPAHQCGTVAKLALEISNIWNELADLIGCGMKVA